MKEKSAGAVIFRNTSNSILFLLLHYPSGHWDFVKGKIEPNEEPRQTVVREAKEETGIEDLNFIENFEEKIEYDFQYDGKQIHKTVVFFLASTKTEKISISHEHVDFAWLRFEKALKKITYENAKYVLSKSNKLLVNRL